MAEYPEVHFWNMEGSAKTHYVLETIRDGQRFTKMYPSYYFSAEEAKRDFLGRVGRNEKLGV